MIGFAIGCTPNRFLIDNLLLIRNTYMFFFFKPIFNKISTRYIRCFIMGIIFGLKYFCADLPLPKALFIFVFCNSVKGM